MMPTLAGLGMQYYLSGFPLPAPTPSFIFPLELLLVSTFKQVSQPCNDPSNNKALT